MARRNVANGRKRHYESGTEWRQWQEMRLWGGNAILRSEMPLGRTRVISCVWGGNAILRTNRNDI